MPLTVDDRLDLIDLIARLCQALDFSRPSDFVDVFVADGVYQAESSEASGRQQRFRHQGSEQLLAFARSAVEKRRGLGRHWTGNVVLEETADGASAVSYVLLLDIDPDSKERRFPISGVHHDRFVRTDAGWRFAERVVVADI